LWKVERKHKIEKSSKIEISRKLANSLRALQRDLWCLFVSEKFSVHTVDLSETIGHCGDSAVPLQASGLIQLFK
jgi:hypothetical protein